MYYNLTMKKKFIINFLGTGIDIKIMFFFVYVTQLCRRQLFLHMTDRLGNFFGGTFSVNFIRNLNVTLKFDTVAVVR